MKISVIVPYKDAAPWLVRCLNSLTDNEGDFEFIVVNDQSSDRGPEIVKQYAEMDERFIAMDNLRGPGVSGARNTGIEAASGDWITFLDADDKFTVCAFDIFSRAIKNYPAANVIQFNHYRHYSKINKTVLKYTNPEGVYSVKDLGLIKMWFGAWNKLYRAEFLKDIRFNETIQYGEDGLFILECFAKGAEIYHAGRNDITVVHNFDNPESLSKAKNRDDLLLQIREYEYFMLRQTRPEIILAVCKELSRLWGSETFACCFGGSDS